MNLEVFNNPLIKKLAMGQLKKAFEKEGIKVITITENEDGEFSFTSYNYPVKIMAEKDYNELLKLATL